MLDTDAPVLTDAALRDAAQMTTIKDVIFEFVKQGGPEDVCFSSPEGNGYTKPHGRNVRRGDRDGCQICIEYRMTNPYLSITEQLKDALARISKVEVVAHNETRHGGLFVYKIALEKVSCSADKLVADLIAAARECGCW